MKYTLFYLFISLSNTVIGQTESSNFHGFKGEGNFIDGKQNGLWKYYYTNGQLYSEGNFKDDNKIGCWKYYDGNEKPYIEGRLFDKNEEIIMPESEAKEQGLEYKIITFEEYDDNGDRTQEAQVRVEKHREADSLWQFYNEYDAVYGEIEWKNGKQDSRWVSDGLLGDQYWFKGEGNFIGGKKMAFGNTLNYTIHKKSYTFLGTIKMVNGMGSGNTEQITLDTIKTVNGLVE